MKNEELVKILVARGLSLQIATQKVWELSFIPRSDKKSYDRDHNFNIEDPRFGVLKGHSSDDLDTIWDEYTNRVNGDDIETADWLSICSPDIEQPAISQFGINNHTV